MGQEPPGSCLLYRGREFIVPNHSRGEEPSPNVETRVELKVRPDTNLPQAGVTNCEMF